MLDGRPIPLTRKEFDLLHYLASRPGIVVSRQRLMIDVWGHPADVGLSAQASRTIDTHVSSMRSKLRESGLDPDCPRSGIPVPPGLTGPSRPGEDTRSPPGPGAVVSHATGGSAAGPGPPDSGRPRRAPRRRPPATALP
ncbi:winged helix-turn-helix domain-containing protein [Streptomyces sp. NPDC001966]